MKKLIYISILLVFLVTGIIQVGMYDSSAGIVTFLKGQITPSIEIQKNFSNYKNSHNNFSSYEIITNEYVILPEIINVVADKYVSFAIDSSQVVGGKWWNPKANKIEIGSGTHHADLFQWNNKKLNILTKALSPAYLRLGGSEADKIYYDMSEKDKMAKEIPEGYHSVLTPYMWDEAHHFIRRNGLKAMFTVNAGPSARDDNLIWKNENLKSLLEYTKKKGYKVDVWELGNELNIFWFIHGVTLHVSPDQYAKDFSLFQKTVHKYFPDVKVTSQASAFWPILGEPMDFFYGFMPDYLEKVKTGTNIVAWHYYPQQSRRGPIASRRAYPTRLLNPQNLDEVAFWAQKMHEWRDRYNEKAPLWLGETGNAQFGGEPGVSDRYIGGLWWIDQLGLLAVYHHNVIIRQTLVGMDYGVLDMKTYDPRPDYWNSLIWKRLMGNKVLKAKLKTKDPYLRVYSHCSKKNKGTVTLIINLHTDKKIQLKMQDHQNKRIYVFTTDNISGKNLYLNNKLLQYKTKKDQLDFNLQNFSKNADSNFVVLNPLSYLFVEDLSDVKTCEK